MPWALVITEPAQRDLRQLAPPDLRRVNSAFEAMRGNPYGGDIKFLQGSSGTLRRRVGVWRIIFVVDHKERTVAILGVKRRTSTTY
jgi:mRNA-degrading endonuclease RelE of RelBE toxin-antitoxin system